jgi:ABC-type Fe3+ transport system permease subunit
MGTEVRNMTAIALSALMAAEETPNYTYDTLKPGPMAFVVTAFLAVAVFFLVRSMIKQLRKVDFDEQAQTDDERTKSHREPPPGRS